MRQVLLGLSLVVAGALGACSGSSSSTGTPSETECGDTTCAAGVYCITGSPGATRSPGGAPSATMCRDLTLPSRPALPDADGGDGGDGGEVDAAVADAAPPQCGPEELPCRMGNGSPGCASVQRGSASSGSPYSCVAELPQAADCSSTGQGGWTYHCAYP